MSDCPCSPAKEEPAPDAACECTLPLRRTCLSCNLNCSLKSSSFTAKLCFSLTEHHGFLNWKAVWTAARCDEMGERVTLTASDGFHLGAYRSDPEGAPKGAVVIIQVASSRSDPQSLTARSGISRLAIPKRRGHGHLPSSLISIGRQRSVT